MSGGISTNPNIVSRYLGFFNYKFCYEYDKEEQVHQLGIRSLVLIFILKTTTSHTNVVIGFSKNSTLETLILLF